MKRKLLERGLTWGLVAVVLLPVAVAVVLGLGALLAALGDTGASVACGRVALGIGVVFVVSLVATTVTTALAVLTPPRRRRRRRRRGQAPSGAAAERPLGLP